MKKTTFLFILALSACASNKTLFVTHEGLTVYKADCGGQWTTLDMSDCIEKAAKQCPLGFNVLMSEDKPAGFTTGQQTYGNINTNSYANIFGNANTTYGYNNSSTNIFANGYGNSNTNVDMYNLGGGAIVYIRYLIYTCKNHELPKS